MRIVGIVLGIAVLLVGCGTNKRVAHAHKNRKTIEKTGGGNAVSDAGLDPAGPEDKEKFVYFPISGVEEYISTFAPIAQMEMKAYGIPASITLAQGILESGYGQGELTRKTNNHFGIKCHKGWEGDFEHHDDDEAGECFRKYNHPMYSFRDHSIFLSTRARYAPLFELRKDDYKGWARGLKAAGYATDRQYPQKLISFIERYDLHRYDRDILPESHRSTPVAERNNDTYGIHVVQQGDTLYSLSRRYLTTVSELMKLNNLNNTGLAVGQQLRIKAQESKK